MRRPAVAASPRPGVLLIGDAAGWVSPMTGGGIRLAFRYGRRAASLVADHLQGQRPRAGGRAVARVAGLRRQDRAPPRPRPRAANALINLALSTAPVRRLAEHVYFHRRGSDGLDRETYLRWLEAESASPRPPWRGKAERGGSGDRRLDRQRVKAAGELRRRARH